MWLGLWVLLGVGAVTVLSLLVRRVWHAATALGRQVVEVADRYHDTGRAFAQPLGPGLQLDER